MQLVAWESWDVLVTPGSQDTRVQTVAHVRDCNQRPICHYSKKHYDARISTAESTMAKRISTSGSPTTMFVWDFQDLNVSLCLLKQSVVVTPQFFIDEFVRLYPKANFILADHSIDSWMKSMINAVGPIFKALRSFPLKNSVKGRCFH